MLSAARFAPDGLEPFRGNRTGHLDRLYPLWGKLSAPLTGTFGLVLDLAEASAGELERSSSCGQQDLRSSSGPRRGPEEEQASKSFPRVRPTAAALANPLFG